MRTVAILAIALLLVAGCAGLTGQATAEQEYTIGVIAPLSGAGTTLGEPLVNGMTQAAEEINAKGGINGRPVAIAAQDGKLDGRASVDAANHLLLTDDPDAMVILFGLPTQAVAPILEQSGIPYLYEAYIRSPLNGSEAFKANFDAVSGCDQLIAYAKANGKYAKLGILDSNTEYSALCLAAIRKVEPDVSVYRYTYGEKDFRSLLTKANEDGIDLLAFIGIDYEYLAVFQQISELGYPMKLACTTATECMFPAITQSVPAQTLDGTLSIDFIPQDLEKSAFAHRYTQEYGNATHTQLAYGAVGYDDVQLIAAAMRACEPGDKACLTQALSEVHGYPSVLGSDGFEDRVMRLRTQIYEFRNGSWEARS